MKVFDAGGKVNFVDIHNVLVGYDTGQDCCEHAGWYFSKTRRCDTGDSDPGYATDAKLEPYSFDAAFFEEDSDDTVFDHGGIVRFRLVADGLPDLYLHIFNSHNGYYGHGFEVQHSGQIVRSGSL